MFNLFNITSESFPLFLLVFLPFAIFGFCYFFSRSIPYKICQLVATAPVAFLALLMLTYILNTPTSTVVIYDLLPFSEYLVWVRWAFTFDTVSSLMCLVVLWVTFAVLMFAIYYMATDPFTFKFLNFLILFAGCMVMFVVSENLLIMFCGWEALGVCSFALIGFWNTRLQAVKAAMKAITLNRVGDTAFLFAMVITWFEFNTLSFSDLELLSFNHTSSTISILGYVTLSTIDLLGFLFLTAAAAKSAQLGFHIWLSDAMEGPTPVSALLHAATMVTAGVYLLIRVSPLMLLSEHAQIACTLIGGLTALTSALFAFFQFDLKKTIAFSTSSQVGFMFVACGVGAPYIAFYHLITHAFFKALLFVCAGCVIHCFDGDQDVRRMGGLFFSQPLLFGAMLIGSVALAGFPFFAGFYSKDTIFGILVSSNSLLNLFVFGVILIAAVLTSLYSANTLVLIFFGFRRSPLNHILRAAEATRLNGFAWLAIVLLAIPSIIAGWVVKQFYPWMWVSMQSSGFSETTLLVLEGVESLPMSYKLLTLIPPVLFCIWFVSQREFGGYKFSLRRVTGLQSVYAFFQNRAFFENIYYYYLVRPLLNYVYFILLIEIERFLLESFVVEVPVSMTARLSKFIGILHMGSLTAYVSTFAISFFIISNICLYFIY